MSGPHPPAHLQYRQSGYYFRLAVPAPLRGAVGRRELVKSLRTSAVRDAQRKAGMLSGPILKLFQQLSKRPMTDIDRGTLGPLILQWMEQVLTEDERERLTSPWRSRETEAAGHDYLAGELCDDGREDNFRAVKPDVDALLERHGLTLDPSSTAYRWLCHEMLKARIGIERILERRCSDDWDTERDILREFSQRLPSQPSAAPDTTIPDPPPKAREGLRFSQAGEKYIADRQAAGSCSDSTANEYRTSYRLFIEAEGDLPLHKIGREAVRRYRDALQKLPANRNKKREYRGKTVPDLLAMRIPKEYRMQTRTVQKNLERLSTVLKWCVQEGYMSRNPAEGIGAAGTGQQAEPRQPFTPEELKALFGSPEYLQGQHGTPYHFWLPLLGLYTGARLGELAQLHVEDVLEVDGVPVLTIQDDPGDAGRRVKTKAAVRQVPIHSDLIRIGFLDYAATARKGRSRRLFPDLKCGTKGWSDTPSKWFRRYRESCGISGRHSKVFHSFRHNVITALIQSGKFQLQDVQKLVGHETGVLAYDVYFGGFEAQRLREMIETLQWGLDVQGLAEGWQRMNSSGAASIPAGTVAEAE